MANKKVIDKIATGNKIAAQSVNYSVNTNIKRQVTSPLENQYELTANILDYKLQNFVYRNFTMPENVGPDNIKLSMSFLKNGTQVSDYQYNSLILKIGEIANEDLTLLPDGETGTNNTFSLNIKDLDMQYSINQANKFVEWADLVDKYMETSTDMSQKINEIQNIPADVAVLSALENLDDVLEYDKLAQESIELTKTTRNETFYKELPLKENDPNNLLKNIDILFQKASSLHAACSEVISKMDIIYYDKGQLMYKKNYIKDAESYFNKSIEINSKYTPSHYMLAVLAFNTSDYQKTEEILKNIIFNIGGEPNIMQQVYDLSNQLYNTYLKNADVQINSKNYDLAIEWLQKSKNWCEAVKNVNCSNEMNIKFQNAYSGKLNIYLAEVDKSISTGNMDLAENSLNNAILFRKDNLAYLEDKQSITNKSLDLYNAYVGLGDAAKSKNNFDESLLKYYKAKEFMSNSEFLEYDKNIDERILLAKNLKYENMVSTAQTHYSNNKLDEAEILLDEAEKFRAENNLTENPTYKSLSVKIKQKRHDNAIATGLNDYNSGNYQEALNNFDLADSIQVLFNLKKNYNLSTYLKNSATKLVLEKIENAEKKVSENDLTNARIINQEAHNIADKYAVGSDKKIISAFSSIDQKIFNQQCQNYKDDYISHYNLSLSKISEKKFLEADDNLNYSITLANSHPECSISDKDAVAKRNEISNAVEYQTQVFNADQSYKSNSYQSAIDNYNSAGNYLANHNLASEFGLIHEPLVDFIKKRAEGFILHGIDYFTKNNELENATLLLNVLRTRNFNKKSTKIQQQLLGMKLAQNDHKNQPSANPKTMVLTYTKGDKWYKYLKKSYIKTWKKL
ncbi:MAG: hypothetical protein JXL97_10605 [Bacteroidales bacterium]|nr:hypothetical protein [Bacteroidales bacterium]